jgi:hypothetical protein
MNKKLFLVSLLVGMFSLSMANVGILHDKAGSWGIEYNKTNTLESNSIAGAYLFNPDIELMGGYLSMTGGSAYVVGGAYYLLKEYMDKPVFLKAYLAYTNMNYSSITGSSTTFGATIGYKYTWNAFTFIPSITWYSANTSMAGSTSTSTDTSGDLLVSYMLSKGQFISGEIDDNMNSFTIAYSTEL